MNRFGDDAHLVALRSNLGDVQALMERGLLVEPDTGRTYFTGYSYKTLYDWDQYFEAIVQIYMGWPTDYIKNGVIIFLDHQRESGLISRSVPSNEHHDPEHVKPFLAQMALLVEKASGERDWTQSVAEPYFSRLKRYLDTWLVEMDGDGNGLSEWMSAPHTGMDNQHERAGFWGDRFCEGVDLNSYLVRECRAFARLATWAGQDALAAEYAAKADARAERIRALCWDEADGFFYDRNARAGQYPMSRRAGWASALNGGAGERIRVKTVAGFAALWAGVATPEQARRMIFEHLFNAAEFWSAFPVPAMARSERWYSRDVHPADLGCDWRAKTWAPTKHHDLLGAASLRLPGARRAGRARHPAPRAEVGQSRVL